MLAWQRALALAVVAVLLLRRPGWPTVVAASALAVYAALTARRQLGRIGAAVVTIAAAVLSALTVAMR